MKNTKGLLFIFLIIAIVSCKKDTKITTTNPLTSSENYSSVKDFFSKNNVAMQTYTVNGATGGSFISPQGTTVTIPANAFLTKSSIPVIGLVTIQFKDIYKKSDMLFSNMPTMTLSGSPLKSGGEFFIKAIQNNSALLLASGKKISISQPASLTGGLDTLNIQQPFIGQQDSLSGYLWGQTSLDSIKYAASNYIYGLYKFNTPVDSGSWCNSDNASYFSAYAQTTLTLIPSESINTYNTAVFLVFKNISSMIHVYNIGASFPYSFAPQGLQCTLVAVGVKNGTLYSSFVPITISANQSISFSLNTTTTSDFVSQVQALN